MYHVAVYVSKLLICQCMKNVELVLHRTYVSILSTSLLKLYQCKIYCMYVLILTGEDYAVEQDSQFSLTFPPDVNELPINIQLFEDDIPELRETFRLVLTLPQMSESGLQLGLSAASVAIDDNDSK